MLFYAFEVPKGITLKSFVHESNLETWCYISYEL